MQASQPPEPRFCQGPVAASTWFAAPILLMSYSVMTVSTTPTRPMPVGDPGQHSMPKVRGGQRGDGDDAKQRPTQPGKYCALNGFKPYPLKSSWVRDNVRVEMKRRKPAGGGHRDERWQ